MSLMAQSLANGETIGQYRIISLLGEGGMGQVYLAEDSKLDRRVALKILPPDLANDSGRMKRFVTEAKSACAVRHPNVAHIYDVGEEKGIHYIVMEFIEGRTLSARMNDPEFEFPFVLEAALQIADALDEAHSSGIIHRDLKPQNVMITRRGQLKILDFGLARINKPESQSGDTALTTNSFTTPGIVMGTVPYMSPEQVLGRPVDSRSDLFSFGIVLYEMLTRRLPFVGNTVPELMDSILHKKPDPIMRFSHEAPPEIERIVLKSLEKDPEDRYQSARDLLVDLRNLKRTTHSGTAVIASQPALKSSILGRYWVALAVLILIGGVVAAILVRKDQPRSIAVLPFENVGKDSNIEFLSEGIPETLINSLSQVPNLMVISRTSSFSYKSPPYDLKKIAADLNVEAVLTGRIVQRGSDLSVNVELVDTKDRRQLWGENYNRQLSDIAGMQKEIAETIVQNLRVRFVGEKKQQLNNQYSEDSEALQLYMKGRYYWNQATAEGAQKSIEYFHHAIEKDPGFAKAYGALAEAYALALGDINTRPSDAIPQTMQAAEKALKLDPNLAEARTAEAVITGFYQYDFPRAEEMFKQAIASNPNYATAHHQYGWCLLFRGRFQESILEFQKALQLDPLSLVFNIDLEAPYAFSGQFDKAFEYAEKAKEMDPNFFLTHYAIGSTCSMKGDYPCAIQALERARELDNSPMSPAVLAYAYARIGNVAKAQELLHQLQALSNERYVSAYLIGVVYTGLNQKKEAIAMLNRAYEENDLWLSFVKVDRNVDSLRSEPDFQKLLHQMHY
jgi:serine/threonine protein kinase/Tfp pilus assembly protein PilF